MEENIFQLFRPFLDPRASSLANLMYVHFLLLSCHVLSWVCVLKCFFSMNLPKFISLVNITCLGSPLSLSRTYSLSRALSHRYLGGAREGELLFYNRDSFPLGLISPMKFLWNSNVVGLTDENKDRESEHVERWRQLWLWVHPACFTQVLSLLKAHAVALDNGLYAISLFCLVFFGSKSRYSCNSRSCSHLYL